MHLVVQLSKVFLMNMAINLDIDLDLVQSPLKEEYVPYQVAICWSSSQPHMKVLYLAVGGRDIVRTEQHASFIRWVTPDVRMVKESNLRVL